MIQLFNELFRRKGTAPRKRLARTGERPLPVRTMGGSRPRKRNISNRERVNRRELQESVAVVAAHHAWLGGKQERARQRNRREKAEKHWRLTGQGPFQMVKPVFE